VNARPWADQKRTRQALIHTDQPPGLIVGSAGSDDRRRGAGSGVNKITLSEAGGKENARSSKAVMVGWRRPGAGLLPRA